MRFVRLGLFCLLVVVPVWAQQSQVPQQTQPTTALSPVTKDLQAVNVVNQVLIAAGGSAAIAAIADYTAVGTVTYHLDTDKDIQGNVTVRGRGVDQLRVDSNLPSGTRSESTNGMIAVKSEDGTVRQMHGQTPMAPARMVLPCVELLMALNSTKSLSLLYKGIVQVDGHPAHDIQVQHVLAQVLSGKTSALTVDFFIDTSTFQVLMMQDAVSQNLARQFRYSDFRVVNGVSVPFSISARINDQDVWLIALGGINFNLALQDSDFSL